LKSFNALIDKGHSVVVIEHNLDVVKCADWVIDLGPEGGDRGGELMFAGTPEYLAKCKTSITGQFLKEKM
jgi:excinuclease ABC subunit A